MSQISTPLRVLHPDEDYAARVTARIETLQARFDATAQITTVSQREIAERLLAQIGTDDWKTEGYASPENQRDLTIRFHWGHNHRFDADLAVTGRMHNRHISLAAQFFEGFDLPQDFFEGRDVLDIGCWTGGTTLSLKVLGAARIHALDEVRKYAATAQTLLRDVYGFDDVQVEGRSLYRLEEGSFDCVYVPGVVYHLSDPVLGLRKLFNRLRDGGEILVESAGIASEESMCYFKGNRRQAAGQAEKRNRSGWAWFWPSARCLGDWLEEAGFDEVRVYRSPFDERIFGYGRRTGPRQITRAGLSDPDVA